MDNHFDFLFNNQHVDVSFDGNGVAWFHGPQIASILGYSHSPNMYKMLSPNEKGVHIVNTPGGNQEAVAINEYGVYRLIISSRRPEAVEFQNWLFGTVLPSIRRYGAYIDPQTGEILERSPELIAALNAKIAELTHQNQLKRMYHLVDKTRYPYSDYESTRAYIDENQQFINTGKAVTAPEQYISINGLSKLLQNFNYPTGSHRLFEELRNDGFLMKAREGYNYPTQKSLDLGVIGLFYNTYAEATDNGVPYYIPMVTPSGINFFINYFLNKMQLFLQLSQPMAPVIPQMMTAPVAPVPDTDSENESASTTAVSEQEPDTNTVE